MAFRVELTPRAERDIEEFFEWYRSHSTEAAQRWYALLLARLDTLDRDPDRCPRAPESLLVKRTIRQLYFGRRKVAWFRALFECEAGAVRILRIRRCSQRELPADELLGPDADLPDVESP